VHLASQDKIMNWCSAAHLVVGLAAIAGGCGSGRDDHPTRDAATSQAGPATSSQGRDRLRPPADPARSRQDGPTLAERLRAMKAAGESAVWIEVRYDDGSVEGWLEDREITLGRRVVRLGQIRRLRLRPEPEVELNDGTRVEGPFEDLRQVVVTIGGQPHPLDLTRAAEVVFAIPYKDARRPGLEATIQGAFPFPKPSPTPVTSVQVVTFPGWDLPGRIPPTEQTGEMEIDGSNESGIRIALMVRQRPYRVPRWNLQLGAPFGREFGVGEYEVPDATATDWIPSGGCQNAIPAGNFVVWEFERARGKVNRLAIDFLLRSACEGRRETCCGRIRYQSSFR
jgi:hypothetical protein